MTESLQGIKKNYELTLNDFLMWPVWTWLEDEKEPSLVEPVEFSEVLPEDHDALAILSRLVLADGSTLQAVVWLRVSDRQPYLLSFPNTDGELLDFSVYPEYRRPGQLEKLIAWLQKPPNKIFPIRYSIPYVFGDGQPLSGQLQLSA